MKYKVHLLVTIITLFISCADNKTANENFNKGVDYYNSNIYSSALEELTKAVGKDKINSKAFFYKGLAEVKLEKNQAALNSFQRALELDSLLYQALVERAKLKITLGDNISAINDCDVAKLIKGDYADLYKTKATAFENLNDAANASIAYDYAIKYGQKDGETYYKFGILKLSTGNNKDGCILLSKAGELGYMDAFKIIKEKCNNNIVSNKNEISNEITLNGVAPMVKNAEYYRLKGYQVFSDYNFAIKCDCSFKDVSNETPGNNDLAYGCVVNEKSKEKLIMYQIIVNRIPAGYANASPSKKKQIVEEFYATLPGEKKRVVFNNEDAIVVGFFYKGISGKTIAFIKNGITYAYTIMTNDNIDAKFNSLTNNISFF